MRVGNYLPQSDLSEHLTTRKLLEAWYLLAADGVAVLVDTVKPRIYRLFTYGRFGTLQQVLYDPALRETDLGFYGIVPTFRVGDREFYPFQHRGKVFEDRPPQKIEFDPAAHRLGLYGVRCYDADLAPGGEMTILVSLQGSRLRVRVDFPAAAESCRITATLYPLYTHYRAGRGRQLQPVEYFTCGFHSINGSGFDRALGRSLVLQDSQGRLPELRLSSADAACRLFSHVDRQQGNAFRLHAGTCGEQRRQELVLQFSPNPVTVACRPYYYAGEEYSVDIQAAEKPRVTLDGKSLVVKGSEGSYRVKGRSVRGKHVLLAQTKAGRSKRTFCVVDDPAPQLIRMGDAVSVLPWKTGPIRNLMPYFFFYDPLAPAGRAERPTQSSSYGSHALRGFCILTAAAILTNQRRYVDRGFESLDAVIRKAHRFADGDLLLPHAFDMDGRPYLLESCRPSDLGLMVRALLSLRKGFLHGADSAHASTCLDHAYHFAHTLTRMQQPDGSFYPRYTYPTLVPEAGREPLGTVNNWAIQVWELAAAYEAVNPAEADGLRGICLRHADYLLAKTPSLLRITGGGEDPPNYMDGLCSASLFLLLKYLQTKDETFRRHARDCFMMGALTTTIQIDQPHNYFCAHSPWLPAYYDQPALLNKGGMHDLTMVEAGLFLGAYLDDEFAHAVAAFNFADRSIDTIQENGAIYGMTVEAPNYFYRREDAGEVLDYGAVGVFGTWLAERATKPAGVGLPLR